MICTLALPVSSQAEESAEAKMNSAVISAGALFDAGDFKAAAKKFAEAFGYLEDYNLKKNEMVSWFKAGNCTAAVEAGRLFLSGSNEITRADRGDVKKVGVRCQLISAKKFMNLGQFEKCEQHLTQAESLIVADTFLPVAGSNESAEIQSMRDQISTTEKLEKTTRSKRSSSILGPTLTISGGALIAGGAVFVVLSQLKENEFLCSRNVEQTSCDNPSVLTETEFMDAKSSANVLNTVGWVGLASGVALGSVGLYLWTSEGSGTDSAKFYVNPGKNSVGFELGF